jgi:surfeit locus 1 family protein
MRRVIFVVAIMGTALVTASLGRWQLRRLAQRRAANATMRAAALETPLHLPTLQPLAIDSGRRLEVRGQFDTLAQLLLRGREQDDAPGIQVATAFRLDSSSEVLWVLRGFVRSPDAATPPDTIPQPASGIVTLTGVAVATPTLVDSGRPLSRSGVVTYQRLDRDVLARRAPGALPVYLLLAADSAHLGGLDVVAPPELSDGPHLSYAIQWFGITLAVLVFGVIFFARDNGESTRPDEAP